MVKPSPVKICAHCGNQPPNYWVNLEACHKSRVGIYTRFIQVPNSKTWWFSGSICIYMPHDHPWPININMLPWKPTWPRSPVVLSVLSASARTFHIISAKIDMEMSSAPPKKALNMDDMDEWNRLVVQRSAPTIRGMVPNPHYTYIYILDMKWYEHQHKITYCTWITIGLPCRLPSIIILQVIAENGQGHWQLANVMWARDHGCLSLNIPMKTHAHTHTYSHYQRCHNLYLVGGFNPSEKY